MSGLPTGWGQATVSEVGSTTEQAVLTGPFGASLGKADFRSSGVPVFTIGCLGNGYIIEGKLSFISEQKAEKLAAYRLREGDLMFSRMATVGRVGFVPPQFADSIFNYHLMRLRLCETVVEPRYFYHYIKGAELVASYLADKNRGATRDGINTKLLEQLPVLIPPLAEQKRIVAKLEALNAKSARARTALVRIETLVSRYKQAVLSKAFSGELDRKELGDLVVRIKAGKNLRCEERPPHSNEKGVVKVSAVTWGEFRADQSKTLPSDFEPDEDTRIRSGDFLFSRANTIDLVGAVVIVADAPDNLYLSDKILRLEFSELIDTWLLWYLRSPIGREALMNISSGNQLSMRNIGQKNLLSLSIPFADTELRNEIVRRIESAFAKIDRLAAEAKRALALVGRLDEAVLAKAFRGELVPQDENDEPATTLLARIRAEREAALKVKRGRGRKA